MAIDQTCQWYADTQETVQRMRDFLAGEAAVKRAGETYLPKLSGQETDEYDSYKDRTTFLNGTARTRDGLFGQVFAKDPVATLPASLKAVELDVDLKGSTLYTYCRSVVTEVLGVGRCVTLVDWTDAESRPYLGLYQREDILNWRRERRGDRTKLVLAVLREEADRTADTGELVPINGAAPDDALDRTRVERIRILTLDENDAYTVEVYEKQEVAKSQPAPGERSPAGPVEQWVLTDRRTPIRGGSPLSEIPLVFHDPSQYAGECPRPPLDDLCSVNLNHYQLSADLIHGLRFSSLPTPYAFGFDPGKELRIGSATAWVSNNTEAKVGYLEASGAGLQLLNDKIGALEESMAAMGARLLETQKREVESAEALALRKGGEASVLSTLVSACSESITKALKLAAWWAQKSGTGAWSDLTDAQCSLALNTDFSSARMSGEELVKFVSAWLQRGISRRTLFENLQRGEIIPPERTYEMETELVDGEVPPGMDLGASGS